MIRRLPRKRPTWSSRQWTMNSRSWFVTTRRPWTSAELWHYPSNNYRPRMSITLTTSFTSSFCPDRNEARSSWWPRTDITANSILRCPRPFGFRSSYHYNYHLHNVASEGDSVFSSVRLCVWLFVNAITAKHLQISLRNFQGINLWSKCSNNISHLFYPKYFNS